MTTPVARATRDMRPAGVKNYAVDEGTHHCMNFQVEDRMTEREQLFRRVDEPGTRMRPRGPARLDRVDDTRTFGRVANWGEGAGEVLDTRMRPMEAYVAWRGEQIYKSAKEEPLGRGFTRGTTLPDRMRGADAVFGAKVQRDEGAKSAIFPVDTGEDDGAELYRKSHGAFAPGERRNRGIDWSRTRHDPDTMRFGQVNPNRETNGATKALNPEADDERTTTRVVPLRVEMARQFSKDHLGKSKCLGHAEYSRPVPEAFGKPPATGDDWGAAECLRGEYDEVDQLPDKDLGRAVRPGFRNAPRDPERVFGIPSLRTDVPPRTSVSVADVQNFGQDPSMVDIINPSRFMSRGVDHADFAGVRTPDDIRSIFESIGFPMDDDTFARIYARAASHFDVTGDGEVSVQEFKLALDEYEDAMEETGAPPAWFDEIGASVGAGAAAALDGETKDAMEHAAGAP